MLQAADAQPLLRELEAIAFFADQVFIGGNVSGVTQVFVNKERLLAALG